MIQLNNDFLASIGLSALPEDDKKKMLLHVYQTLELRVGMRLAKQMTEAQLDEFEKFVDGNQDFASEYLQAHAPGWQQDPVYQAQVEKVTKAGKNPQTAVTEFAALKWLGANFPDHKKAIEEELEKLKQEISAQAPQIVQATLADSASPAQAA